MAAIANASPARLAHIGWGAGQTVRLDLAVTPYQQTISDNRERICRARTQARELPQGASPKDHGMRASFSPIPDSSTPPLAGQAPTRRLNLLLSYGGWRDDAFAALLPPLLSPRGIDCLIARSADEVSGFIRAVIVHIAVIDLTIPMSPPTQTPAREGTSRTVAGGTRVLQLLRRLEQPPALILVRPPQADPVESARSLREALYEGVFSVVDDPSGPHGMERLLRTLRSCVDRHYAHHWDAA